jgi:hypothetical protein
VNATHEFRTALEDLTSGRNPPVNLADRALTGLGRRRTRNRTLLGSAAAAAVILAVAVPAATLRNPTPTGGGSNGSTPTTATLGGDATQPNVGPPANPRYAILSYQQYTSDTSDPWYAWDPATHKYVRTGQIAILPSPDGAWGLVKEANNVRPKWAVARWSDAVHGRNLSWHDPVTGGVLWAPDGTTVIVIDRAAQRTTYVDPVAGTTRVVPWPSAAVRIFRKLIGYAPGYRGQVVLWSRDPNGVLVQTIDPQGRLADSAIVPDLSMNETVLDELQNYPAVSPDGRYLVVIPGVLFDLRARRSIRFNDPTGISGTSAGFQNGWYDAGHLIQTARSGKGNLPITMSTYDTSGHLVNSLPLTALPGFGRGRTAAFLARITPATEGALTF